MRKTQADTSYPAGEATPIEITDSTPIPILSAQKYLDNSRTFTNQYRNNYSHTPISQVQSHSPAQPNPRPCSSWYSQPSIASSSSRSRRMPPSSPPPPVPRLTSAALRSLEHRFAVPNGRTESEGYKNDGGSNPWQHPNDEDEDNDDDEECLSPTAALTRTATPTRRVSVDAYLSATKRTAVSQYLRDRTWLPSSPSFPRSQSQSHSHALPVGANIASNQEYFYALNQRRRSTRGSISEAAKRVVRSASISGSSDSRSSARKENNGSNRKSVLTARPQRRRSSVHTPPYILRADPGELAQEYVYDYEHGCERESVSPRAGWYTVSTANVAAREQPETPSGKFRKPSLTKAISSFTALGSRKSMSHGSPNTSGLSRPSPSSAGNGSKPAAVFVPGTRERDARPLIGTPYQNARTGPTPIRITTVRALESGENDTSIIHQQPRSTPPSRYHQAPSQITTSFTPKTPTQTLTPLPLPSRTPSKSHHNIFANLPTRHPSIKPIPVRTRDPMIDSNQGIHLYTGTLRGPTPAGLCSLHSTMDRAIDKYGEAEGRRKGCKEVRKWLRYEERGCIEWVLAYVRGRWGVEV